MKEHQSNATAGVEVNGQAGKDHPPFHPSIWTADSNIETNFRVPAQDLPRSFSRPAAILRLQRQYGNRYVQRMLGLSRQSDGSGAGEVTPDVESAIERACSGGQTLDSRTRGQMESAFGADFSGVRIHTGAESHALNRSVNAVAFATGRDIFFFRDGAYNPGDSGGRKLLAYELTHVVQQGGARQILGPNLQRKGKTVVIPKAEPVRNKPLLQRQQQDNETKTAPRRRDVAFYLDSDTATEVAASALAPELQVRIKNIEEMKQNLRALGGTINTLYIVAHGNEVGELIFEDNSVIGRTLDEIARDLENELPADKGPLTVSFHTCKTGKATRQMQRFRRVVGARSVVGTACSTFQSPYSPIVLPDGTSIVSEDQVDERNQPQFERGLRQLLGKMRTEVGKSAPDCIIGLNRGERADKNFDKIKRIYFAGKGYLVLEWASPGKEELWQTGSICWKDLTATTDPCHLQTAE